MKAPIFLFWAITPSPPNRDHTAIIGMKIGIGKFFQVIHTRASDFPFQLTLKKMSEIDDLEIANSIRQNVLQILELWACKEKQLEYQAKVPIANVPAELFNQWEDDFYHPESNHFKIAFEEKEREILAYFDKSLKYISDKTSTDLPDIIEFIKTKEWDVINRAAIEVLEKITVTPA